MHYELAAQRDVMNGCKQEASYQGKASECSRWRMCNNFRLLATFLQSLANILHLVKVPTLCFLRSAKTEAQSDSNWSYLVAKYQTVYPIHPGSNLNSFYHIEIEYLCSILIDKRTNKSIKVGNFKGALYWNFDFLWKYILLKRPWATHVLVNFVLRCSKVEL